MMMFRTRSYKLVDAIVNHPDVRPTIEKGNHRLFSADLISNPNNVVYAGENGAILALYRGRGVYEVHMGFLKAGRGKQAFKACRECMDDIFTRFDASALKAAVPLQLRGLRLFCRLLGFRSTGADELQEFFVY